MSQAVLNRAMTEDQLLQAVTEALTLYGWRWHHIRRSDRAVQQGAPGFPDIIAVRKGRLLFAELKTENGRTSLAQRQWLADLQALTLRGGGLPETWIVRPGILDLFLDSIR